MRASSGTWTQRTKLVIRENARFSLQTGNMKRRTTDLVKIAVLRKNPALRCQRNAGFLHLLCGILNNHGVLGLHLLLDRILKKLETDFS